jgi:hypothetical protein
VRLTATGRARHLEAQADIRAMESEMLEGLSDAQRVTLREVLATLAG